MINFYNWLSEGERDDRITAHRETPEIRWRPRGWQGRIFRRHHRRVEIQST